MVLACGVFALGVFLLAGVSSIRTGSGYDRIGPRVFPYAVGIGLFVLAAWTAVAALQAKEDAKTAAETEASEKDKVPPLNWISFSYLAVALLLNLALLDRAGFIIACSIQFWLAARAFHSKRPVRDAVVAIVLSTVVYFAFSNLLGLTLPAGILEGIS
jgi:putative tricarboxylic transport membrane protein